MIRISVVLPAYNPPAEHLGPALEALQRQSLPADAWELVVVDNNSQVPMAPDLLSWHPHGRVIREPVPGLVAARCAGFAATTGDCVVVVDQDNLLDPGFLEEAIRIGRDHPWLGSWGGIISPRFERPELAPPSSLHSLLTLRTATQALWSNDPDHHPSTPWGAGLCVRRTVIDAYLVALQADPRRRQLDLCGDKRYASGDTDLCYTGCALGLGKGVFPSLHLVHLIPAERCTAAYLCRTARDRAYSGIMHHHLQGKPLPALRSGLVDLLSRTWHGRHLSPLERQVRDAQAAGQLEAIADIKLHRSPA